LMEFGGEIVEKKHLMDFIEDKTLYKAVMFARMLIRKGKRPGLANYLAAKYYKVDISDVAHHVGQVGGRSKQKYI